MAFHPTHWRAALTGFAMIPALCSGAFAQATLYESQARAAFVYNFARYVEWPERVFASREAPLVICVLGRDALGAAMTALESRQVQGRPVKVRAGVTVEDVHGCHVVFVSDLDGRRLVATLRSLAAQSVLTVSDLDGFIDAGGAIGIVRGDDRLQFEVNRGVLDRAQLKASSNLLRLARNLADAKARN